jgi:hypothetical protein
LENIKQSYRSSAVLGNTPEFIKNHYPKFIDFMKVYKSWGDKYDNEVHNVNVDIENFPLLTSIDVNSEEYIDKFWNKLANEFPREILIDERLFLKYIKQFYTSRGNERSIKYLFRILFNTPSWIFYPSEYLISTDNSSYYIPTSLIIEKDARLSEILNYEGELFGNTSGAISNIEYIFPTINNKNLYEIYYVVNINDFIENEIIYTKDSLGNRINLGTIKSKNIYQGRYINTESHISHQSKIQDSYYWQAFSYVINSNIPVNEYRDVVKKFCHPTGRMMFGRYIDDNVLNNTIKQTSEIKLSSLQLSNITNIIDQEIIKLPISNQRKYFMGNDINGTIDIMNSPLMSDISTKLCKDFEHWKIYDFKNGCGVMGAGTNFITDLSENVEIMVTINGTSYYDIVETIDSDNTLTLLNPIPYIKSGKLSINI